MIQLSTADQRPVRYGQFKGSFHFIASQHQNIADSKCTYTIKAKSARGARVRQLSTFEMNIPTVLQEGTLQYNEDHY